MTKPERSAAQSCWVGSWARAAVLAALGLALFSVVLRAPADAQGAAASVALELDELVAPPRSASALARIVVTAAADVTVPDDYDGRSAVLSGTSGDHVMTWSVPDRTATRSTLSRGQRRVVLSVPLSTLFASSAGPAARWTWRAHPVPPPSPLHGRDGSLVASAQLWAEVEIGGAMVRSPRLVVQRASGAR